MPETDHGEATKNGGFAPRREAAPGRLPARHTMIGARAFSVDLDLGEVATGVAAGEAFKLALAGPIDRITEQLAEVKRTGDPESVHQARVAIRRLRSDLRTFAVLFEPGSVDDIRSELGWLAGLLGAVRDADILRSRLTADGTEISRDGPPSNELVARVERQRGRAQMVLLAALDGERFRALLSSLATVAKDPPFAEVARAPADAFLSLIAAQPWRNLRRAVLKLDKNSGDDELHAVRIAAKRTRYAAEAVTSVIGKPALRFASAVAELQEALGDYNDAVVSVRWLREAAGELDPATAFLAGRLSEHQQALGQAARRRWPAAWKKLDRKKMYAWLADG